MPNNLDSIHISALEKVTGGWPDVSSWFAPKAKDCWQTGFDNSVSTDWSQRSKEGDAECRLQDERARTKAIALGQQRK